MENTNQILFDELQEIKKLLSIQRPTDPPAEIIDRKELQKRLKVSEPTIISMVKKKKIPQINIGSSTRYNWNQVLKSLQKEK